MKKALVLSVVLLILIVLVVPAISMSAESKAPSAVVGKIFLIQLNDTPQATNMTMEAVELKKGPCVYKMEISGAMTNAPKLVMGDAKDKHYTIKLSKYSHPKLSIVGGATIKVTGRIVGNTIYAVTIETVANSKQEICIPTWNADE